MNLSWYFDTMEKLNWEKDRQKREKNALEKHARLHKLYVENRFAFEQERRRIINGFLDNIEDEERKNRLREWQKSWDNKMRHAGSAHNRFILAQALFWRHFEERWHPTIQKANRILNGHRAES